MLTAKLTETELKKRLVGYVRVAKSEMAPLLYHLREKLKRQGSRTGEGFGAWVAANLPFTRRTADLWADEYAVSKGLMKKRKATSRKVSKSLKPSDERAYQFSFVVEEAEERELHKAVALLGTEEVKRLVTECLLNAARKKSATPRSFAARA